MEAPKQRSLPKISQLVGKSQPTSLTYTNLSPGLFPPPVFAPRLVHCSQSEQETRQSQRLGVDMDDGKAGQQRQTGMGLILTAAETGSSSAGDQDVN